MHSKAKHARPAGKSAEHTRLCCPETEIVSQGSKFTSTQWENFIYKHLY